MGAILSQFKQFASQFAKQRSTIPLLNITLSKLHEYHGSFKATCDTFTLDLSDFVKIFKVDESCFSIWDTEGTELIDALELFSGLVIFSDSKFEDKIRFLFGLFDFNELNSLSVMDLEFMISSCLSSTFKITEVSHEVDKETINKFLRDSFLADSRINISQLIKWCAKSPEIHEFFSIIKKEMALVRTLIAHTSMHAGLSKLVNERRGGVSANKKAHDMKAVGTIFNNQKYRAKLDYLATLVNRTQPRRAIAYNETVKDTIIKMNWVYGFRCNDVQHPLKYVGAERGKVVNEKLIYFTGCIVIVYDPKSNEQIHYLDHEREVISLAVSQSSLVATGELGDIPAIHIWDCDTLQNVAILKGIHDLGIHLLAFMKDDEFIVSCGIRANSPLLIYNVKDTSLVLSTYLAGFALDLRPIVSYVATPDKHTKGIKYEVSDSSDEMSGNSFFASTHESVFVYTYEAGMFTTGELKMKDHNITTPITCCVSLKVNASNPYFKAYANEYDKSLKIVTGHNGGKVFVWDNMEHGEELVDYRSEILAIACLDFGVVIATDSSFLYFWDLSLKNNFREFDLCSLQFKLFSFKITSIAPAKNKMYLATTEGDVVEISLSQKKELSKNTYSYQVEAQKIKNISKLSGNMKAITLLEKPDNTLVFVAGDSAIISAFSSDNHDLFDLWSFGESITAIDITPFKDGSNMFAMGTISGKIHLRYDWEELPKGYECGARIIDLKFSNNAKYLVAISEGSIVFVFTLTDGTYFGTKKPQRIEFEGECPISVNFSDDDKIILIGTSQKNHYIVELNEQIPKPINVNIIDITEKANFSVLNVRYPSHAKNFINTMQPVSFGTNSNAIISADETGIIFYWKNRENLTNNCGGYSKGHGSQVARLCLAKNKSIFYSLGTTDRTLIEWQIVTLTEELEEGQSRSTQEEEMGIRLEDEPLIRELEYSTFYYAVPDKFKDSFAFFRGTSDKSLNSILKENVEPFEDIPLYKRVPNHSLELHFIYGFQSYEKRNTLFYGHYVHHRSHKAYEKENGSPLKVREDIRMITEEEENNVFLNKNSSLFLQPQPGKLIMYAKETPGKVSFDHNKEDCDRYFVYFASRVAIVYDPRTNKQRFYEGHRYRITSMCMHPSKAIVATGETSPNPNIHIWSLLTLEPLKILKTFHKEGIHSLQFSQDGAFLVTIGVDPFFSVQVTRWKSEEIITFRNTNSAYNFGVTFNPYDRYEFATVGQCNIAIWGIEGRSLVRKEWIDVRDSDQGPYCIFTACAYFNYQLRKEAGSDLIVGDNFGSIGLVTAGKYHCLREEAHSKMINCIKVTELLADNLIILTSGQDETVKFWDTSFNLIHDINIRKIDLSEIIEIPQNEDVSVQSIDVYGCIKDREEGEEHEPDGDTSNNLPTVLLGTRNGYIIEAAVTQLNKKSKKNLEKKIQISLNRAKAAAYRASMPEFDPEEDSSSASEDEGKTHLNRFQFEKHVTSKMSLDYTLYLSSHSGTLPSMSKNYQQKVLYALHPKLDIMFTVGEDQYLCVWDIEKCTLLKQVKQDMKDSTPTALKITTMPDGEILAIGFSNGTVYILDAKMTANPLGKYQNTYVLPSLNFIQGIKGQVPVLNIEFSSKGDIMAISFDTPKVLTEGEKEISSQKKSYIDIYLSRVLSKTRMNEKSLYSKSDPITFSGDETSHKESGVAVYYMSFSTEDYLLIYYQAIDENQIRDNDDTQGHYALWDLKQRVRFRDLEAIQNIKFKKLNFPNSIYAQYLFYPNILGVEDSKKDVSKVNRRPILSSMFDNGVTIAAGSTTGDIHFFKKRALDFEKDINLENLKPEKMCMSKTYSAHVSFVNQVEVKGNYLFSTGMHDGCVMQWRFIQEEEQWEADFREFQEDKSKFINEVLPVKHQINEVPPKNEFNKLVNEVLPRRHQVYEIQQNLDEVTEPEISLELNAVIGRKALNRRNNLFYDYFGRIIYSAGTLLLMYNPNIEFELKMEENEEPNAPKRQEFLKVDEGNVFSTAPEISAYTLSADKRFLCAGTQELNARIIIWEICSRTCIRTLKLSNCTAIQIIKFAFDSQHICALGTTPEYTQVVYLIDSAKPQVLGCVNLLNTLIFKIKDINFFPNTTYKFITCGVQHMNIWKYSGSTMTFSACVLENPKDPLAFKPQGFYFDAQDPMQPMDSSNLKEQKSKDDEDLFVFLCMCFVQSLIITGGEDGFIYVWKDFKVIKKATAHYKYPVLCLNSVQNSNLFVSGGQDGRIVVWNVQRDFDTNSFLIEMLHECSTTPEEVAKAYLDLRNHIQSVFIDNRRIVAGTRTGNIIELTREKKVDMKTKKPLFERPKMKLMCLDDEVPKNIGFSDNMDRIYAATQTGVFCVWNIKDLQLSFYKQMPKPIQSMYAFKYRPFILIVFETEALMLSGVQGDEYSTCAPFCLTFQARITDVKVSANERYLAVALASETHPNTDPKIELYDLEKEPGTIKRFHTIEEMSVNVKFLDFSLDNTYLLYKDEDDEIMVTEIGTNKKINFIHARFEVEWMSEGLRISDRTKGVNSYYTDENKIKKMTRIGASTLAVTDEMGTIRLFKYPCEAGDNNGYYKCYTEHADHVNNIVMSGDEHYLLTTSETDKCIFIWRIKYLQPTKANISVSDT